MLNSSANKRTRLVSSASYIHSSTSNSSFGSNPLSPQSPPAPFSPTPVINFANDPEFLNILNDIQRDGQMFDQMRNVAQTDNYEMVDQDDGAVLLRKL